MFMWKCNSNAHLAKFVFLCLLGFAGWSVDLGFDEAPNLFDQS